MKPFIYSYSSSIIGILLLIVLPISLTRFTANSLNSAVYSCLGIFIVLPFMVTAIIRHPWKTKFRGKLRVV